MGSSEQHAFWQCQSRLRQMSDVSGGSCSTGWQMDGSSPVTIAVKALNSLL